MGVLGRTSRVELQLRPVTYRSPCDLTQSFTKFYVVETKIALVLSEHELQFTWFTVF